MTAHLMLGLQTVFSVTNILMIVLGVMLGLIFGAIPGLSGGTAIILLLPLTFRMDATQAIILLVAISCASSYGGSIASILLGIPGNVASIVTVFDGHPMALRGEAGRAIGDATVSSMFGGLFASVVLVLLTPTLSRFALRFGAPEYFMLALWGLVCCASAEDESGFPMKGLVAGLCALLFACVGSAPFYGTNRFTFGIRYMADGIPYIPLMTGMFAAASVFKMAEKAGQKDAMQQELPAVNRILPERKTLLRMIPTWLRGSAIGTMVGIIPGAGLSIGTFLAYNTEKKLSKHPEKFGTGIDEGICSCESANNSTAVGAMIPMLSLGVPGNSTAALLMASLMLHGIAMGPTMLTTNAKTSYGIYVALFIINVVMVPFGLFLAKHIRPFFRISKPLIGALVLMFCAAGAFASRNFVFDVYVFIAGGFVGYMLYRMNIPMAAIILAFILGHMCEENFIKSMKLFKGSYSFLVTRPITLIMIFVCAYFLLSPFVKTFLKNRRAKKDSGQ